MASKKAPIETMHLTGSDFAKLLGVTPAAVSQWRAEGLPSAPDKRIPLKQGLRWYLDRELLSAGGSAGDEWLVRWRRARALKEELSLAEARGELVSRAKTGAFWADRIAVAKGIFMSIPAAAPAVVGLDVHRAAELLENRVRAALGSMAEEWQTAEDDPQYADDSFPVDTDDDQHGDNDDEENS